MEIVNVLIGVLFCFFAVLLPRKLIHSIAAIYFGGWTGILIMCLVTEKPSILLTAAFITALAALIGCLCTKTYAPAFQRFIIGFFATQRTSFWILSAPSFALTGGCGLTTDISTRKLIIFSLFVGLIWGLVAAFQDKRWLWTTISYVCTGAILLGVIVGKPFYNELPGNDYCCYILKLTDKVTQAMNINAMDSGSSFFVLLFFFPGFIFQLLIRHIKMKRNPSHWQNKK